MIVTEQQKLESRAFYKEALALLQEAGVDFMLGGAFALYHYTGIYRDTKDLDVFCKADEYPAMLKHFADKGYRTELTDARWLAKVFKGEYFIDIIFNSVNNITTINDSWYQHATTVELEGLQVKLIPPEELVWCKIYVQNRERFDGADVNHILVKYGRQLDWRRLLSLLNPHWQLLLAQLLVFQFVYPADYFDIVPKWLFDELMHRAQQQYELPPPLERVCRGPIIDQTQYQTDIKEWDYKVCTIKTI